MPGFHHYMASGTYEEAVRDWIQEMCRGPQTDQSFCMQANARGILEPDDPEQHKAIGFLVLSVVAVFAATECAASVLCPRVVAGAMDATSPEGGAITGAAAGGGTLLDDAIDATKAGARACSFTGETQVLMADDTTKPISQVKIGDQVVAADPATGQAPRTVTAVWVHQDTVMDLLVEGGARITTTEDHPFYNTTDHTWQQAQDLDPGDQLHTTNNITTKLRVRGLRLNTQRITTTYNLTINDLHTYHVLVGNTPVLVHNTCGNGLNGASDGLRGLFADGSVRGKSIISIRDGLLRDGFSQGLTNNKSGYLFHNSIGEQVRVMRQNGGWDIRVRNQYVNYLNEFGQIGSPATTHGIQVVSR